MSSYRSSAHVFWRCKYHLVWTPKYRYKILTGAVGKELYRSIYILCNMKDCEVLELNVQPDHVHLVVMVPPKLSISRWQNYSFQLISNSHHEMMIPILLRIFEPAS